MKSLATTAAVTAALALSVSAAQAGPSAKFAANWAAPDEPILLLELERTTPGSTACNLEDVPVCYVAHHIMATIKAPQGKELLIGVSGVANLVTFTQAKGKNGSGTSTSVAEGTMGLTVKYGPSGSDICGSGLTAAPGRITFASRKQELAVTTDLYLDGEIDDGDGGTIGIDGSVTVALGLETTAAHHFNFVAVDLKSGEYDEAACFDATGLVSISGNDLEDGDNVARSKVALAHQMLTVQEVRAVKDEIVDFNGN